MSRSYVPTLEQIEVLVDFLERKRWLATGHARTTHARQRTRSAWQDIAHKLNKVECGCRKTWQQWAKYWKDKKAAIKRKAIQMKTSNKTQINDDGEEEAMTLSTLEKRILALLSGKVYGCDKGEESDPFTNFNLGEHTEEIKPFDIAYINDTQPGASDRTDCEQNTCNSDELLDEKPTLRRHSVRHDPRDTSIPRRRRLTSPPSPHGQCQMVEFTERIIAIEERRVETERIIAQSQQELVGVLRQMSEAWTLQSAAIKELVSKLGDK